MFFSYTKDTLFSSVLHFVIELGTPKYKPVDNFQVIERLDSIGFGPDTKVQFHLDDTFMSRNIPDGKKTFSINGDKITPGVRITSISAVVPSGRAARSATSLKAVLV